jgi:hypothetical protein
VSRGLAARTRERRASRSRARGRLRLSSEGSRPASPVAGLEANTLADGLSMPSRGWPCVPASGCCGGWAVEPGRPPGAAAGRPDARRLGLFGLVEGLVDHQLLGIHHVKLDADGDPVVALDVAFLAFGALLLVVGSALARSLDVYPVRGRASG